jgi:hypothetical protein
MSLKLKHADMETRGNTWKQIKNVAGNKSILMEQSTCVTVLGLDRRLEIPHVIFLTC